MTLQPLEFEDPRLLQENEFAAAERLSRLCFGGEDLEFPEVETPADYAGPRRDKTYVIAHQDKPISLISTFHYRVRLTDGYIRIGSIGGVCTHPKFRERRLAGRLMEYSTQQLAQQGARVLLISGERGLYTRLGCVRAGLFHEFTIQPDPHHPVKAGLDVRLASSSEAALLSQIYQAEPAHFEREVDFMSKRLSHQGGYIHAEKWIVNISGKPAAYLLLGLPWEYLGRPEAGIRHVREYAGSRLALAEAPELIKTRQNISQIGWPVGWQDVDLIHLLREKGHLAHQVALPEHTLRIINLPGLMRDLRPYLRARLEARLRRGLCFEQTGALLGATGTDRYALARGKDRLEMDGADMTRLVLGAPDRPAVQAPGALAEIVPALFPLPSFMPGLNYQ